MEKRPWPVQLYVLRLKRCTYLLATNTSARGLNLQPEPRSTSKQHGWQATRQMLCRRQQQVQLKMIHHPRRRCQPIVMVDIRAEAHKNQRQKTHLRSSGEWSDVKACLEHDG